MQLRVPLLKSETLKCASVHVTEIMSPLYIIPASSLLAARSQELIKLHNNKAPRCKDE